VGALGVLGQHRHADQEGQHERDEEHGVEEPDERAEGLVRGRRLVLLLLAGRAAEQAAQQRHEQHDAGHHREGHAPRLGIVGRGRVGHPGHDARREVGAQPERGQQPEQQREGASQTRAQAEEHAGEAQPDRDPVGDGQ
jgi:hypothetical protein